MKTGFSIEIVFIMRSEKM